MKRTTIFLPEDLHESLRREAFRSRLSMAELIRSRLDHRSSSGKQRKPKIDALGKVIGTCGGGPDLTEDINQELYSI
jgi:hypothetical protein